MKKLFNAALMMFIVLVSCQDDDVRLFDQTADERAAQAIATLKQDLVSPDHGWLLTYRPQEGAGAYYVLMDFQENNKVVINTDLGAGEGEYFRDTISYRIDNSLGLELILENYSFFSFLFEQDAATFGAEYEFNFVNKTPDNALVFQSKTDIGVPDIILFEEASSSDADLLGVGLATDLNVLSGDFDKFASSLRLTYNAKDLALYLSLDEFRRTITITSASRKSNSAITQTVNFSTGYLIEGDKMILDKALEGTILGNAISIASLELNTLGESTLNVCADPITVHNFSGVTSAGDGIVLETSLLDVSGKTFAQRSDFYFCPLTYIFDNGTSMSEQVIQDVAGALEMHLYYGYELGNGTVLNGIGFVIQNLDGSVTFALRQFTPVLTDNNLVFNFAPTITLLGNPETTANIDNINIYLNALTSGDKTYVFQLNQSVYEFHNPCTGWSFVFINANQ
ncbi:MAG: DUF4302 domain-containing protein [Bacteroidota bacterium]|nr:DUF4302 domain-containing protein [Bacteroidota bacterium]